MSTKNGRGFNEAEASLPRNEFTVEENNPRGTGFNEAEASLPRNNEIIWAYAKWPGASMRPRQACLGMADYAIQQLQKPCGRCFNEAEASLPRNGGNVRHRGVILPIASMRPRQACLGMNTGRSKQTWCGRASMRPRQACLGMWTVPVTWLPASDALQ